MHIEQSYIVTMSKYITTDSSVKFDARLVDFLANEKKAIGIENCMKA